MRKELDWDKLEGIARGILREREPQGFSVFFRYNVFSVFFSSQCILINLGEQSRIYSTSRHYHASGAENVKKRK